MARFEVHVEKVFYLQAVAKIVANNEQDARDQIELANTEQNLGALKLDFEGDIAPIEVDDDSTELPKSWKGINLNIISVKEVPEG